MTPERRKELEERDKRLMGCTEWLSAGDIEGNAVSSDDAADIRSVVEECRRLREALGEELRLMRRKLTEVEHHEGTWQRGAPTSSAYAAAHLPDWEIRQRIDALEAALAGKASE